MTAKVFLLMAKKCILTHLQMLKLLTVFKLSLFFKRLLCFPWRAALFKVFLWHKGALLQGILKGEYHRTVDLLFDWFRFVCFANINKNCQLSYNWFLTSQTGGTVILPPLVFPGCSFRRNSWKSFQLSLIVVGRV